MLRRLVRTTAPGHHDCNSGMKKLVIMALYRSPLTVTLWPSSFLKYGPMIPPAHKAHQTLLARSEKVARFTETFPLAELRRLEQVEREAAHRAAETPEQFQARRQHIFGSPPGGATVYRLLDSSINCQVANLTLSPTFRYVSIESQL
ncbi:hypothetical protein TNCV_2506121 [Trichonephila clavipes]|uniref:Uncharacterized protein n=1 Tax=Trichonephila clavipes TaxID=2585209 RepID=A0A8X7BL57_TRICX|nr:hypothetical protein TNCV_2506121 [Trichonephila clavipes]